MIAAVFDTESGLVHNSGISLEKQPHIIEFYGCLVDTDTGSVTKELGFLCNPGEPIEKEVVNITGITDKMVADELPISSRMRELELLFYDADAAVGHNLSHDMSVMNFELQRNGIIPKMFWPEQMICTVEATEHLQGFRMPLSKLHEYLFGVGFAGAHRAENDVQATVKIFFELFKRGIV